MRTSVGHWIVFLFPSVSLYFPNFSVKSFGKTAGASPRMPGERRAHGFRVSTRNHLFTRLDYSVPTLPFTGRQICAKKNIWSESRGCNCWWDMTCTAVIRGMELGVRQAVGRRGMSGDMFILFEMRPCEGVEWIRLRN